MNGKAKTRLAFQTFGFALMAISLVFMFVVVTFPYAIGLDVIVSSYNFYTQRAVVNNPLIGITNQGLPNGATSTPWYAPTNAGRIDYQYATVPLTFQRWSSNAGATGSGSGHAVSSLLATFLYNFTIPTEAIPTGLIVQVVAHSTLTQGPTGYPVDSTCTVKDNYVQLLAYGKLSGTPHATGSLWPNQYDSVISYGSTQDSWGLTLTQDMIMAPDFGVAIGADLTTTINVQTTTQYNTLWTATCTAYVDMVSMTLLYKLPVYTTVTSSGTTVTTATTPQTVTITSQGATSTVTTSQTATATLTTATTSTFVTTPATVTMTYSPTTYTWTQPGTTTATITNTQSGTRTATLTTTSVSGGGFLGVGGIVGAWTNQLSALTAGLITFLSGFGMSLIGFRRP